VLAQFQATGVQTCFHGRHIAPQIYKDLDGTNWRLKDYERATATRRCARSCPRA
jgi:NADH-quinone oxidoreductase subunit F